jgi:cation transport regulator ChaC
VRPYAVVVSSSGSTFWRSAFRFQYRILALIDPLVRRMWRHSGSGNVVELEVGRRQVRAVGFYFRLSDRSGTRG